MSKHKIPSKVSRKPMTYWVTRDSDADGLPSSHVDVWLWKPIRRALTLYGGAYWVVEADNAPDDAHFGRYPFEHVRDKWHHAIPDNDRECIRRDTVSDLE